LLIVGATMILPAGGNGQPPCTKSVKSVSVFAVGYNNQGTTEIEYDISRETIFLHKENAELYLFMCNKFNNIES